MLRVGALTAGDKFDLRVTNQAQAIPVRDLESSPRDLVASSWVVIETYAWQTVVENPMISQFLSKDHAS